MCTTGEFLLFSGASRATAAAEHDTLSAQKHIRKNIRVLNRMIVQVQTCSSINKPVCETITIPKEREREYVRNSCSEHYAVEMTIHIGHYIP
ncbi:hypothetical protein AVEN_18592-1 [Araneus ventricosus]|uniref:Uncharacterized protein n=1 Tax=Araneus ventricosus TaxID=182803 RepID=A0A4Y2FQW4_ARAVE|nr:hypothetical protein AVEN_18592-1 [Araneus ventricosus]